MTEQKIVVGTNPAEFELKVNGLIIDGWRIHPDIMIGTHTAITGLGNSMGSDKRADLLTVVLYK